MHCKAGAWKGQWGRAFQAGGRAEVKNLRQDLSSGSRGLIRKGPCLCQDRADGITRQ